MRHIFKCTECGADFEKTSAATLCPECLSKPEKKAVEPKKKKPVTKGKKQ